MTGIDARNPSDAQDGQNVNSHDDIIIHTAKAAAMADALVALSESMLSRDLDMRLPPGSADPADAAALIRRLVDERDDAMDQIAIHWESAEYYTVQRALQAETERDALQAENERLRVALGDLMSWFQDRPQQPVWILKAGQYGADDAVAAARAALNKEGA
jgi:hypothetical protein